MDKSHRNRERNEEDAGVRTAFKLLQKEEGEYLAVNPIITFNQEVDKILGGGIFCNSITEIFGEKGIGKTAFCCQLAIDVQIPRMFDGLESECFFIDAENTLALQRMTMMARKCADHCLQIEPKSTLTVDSILNGIHYMTCESVSQLKEIISDLDEYISRHNKIKLLVIDSLAFLFYCEKENFQRRGKALYSLAQEFFRLVNKFYLAIVITNNMTTRFQEAGPEYKIPYLGDTWTHVPNTRLHLFSDGRRRTAKVVKSSMSPSNGTANYKVISAGIRK